MASKLGYAYKLYKGEGFLSRMPNAGYYAWACGLMTAAGAALTVVEIIRNLVQIPDAPNPTIQSIYQNDMYSLLEHSGLSEAEKANYLKTNPNAWRIKDPNAKLPAYSIHTNTQKININLHSNNYYRK